MSVPSARSHVAGLGFATWFLYSLLIIPLIRTLLSFWILRNAMSRDGYDGWLSFFPSLMDFEYEDIHSHNADHLIWKLESIQKEDIVLKQVHGTDFAQKKSFKIFLHR